MCVCVCARARACVCVHVCARGTIGARKRLAPRGSRAAIETLGLWSGWRRSEVGCSAPVHATGVREMWGVAGGRLRARLRARQALLGAQAACTWPDLTLIYHNSHLLLSVERRAPTCDPTRVR